MTEEKNRQKNKRGICGVCTALVTTVFLALESAKGLKAVRCSHVTVRKGPEQYFREEKQPEENRESTAGYCPWSVGDQELSHSSKG